MCSTSGHRAAGAGGRRQPARQAGSGAGGVSIAPGRNPAKDIELLMPELQACFQVGLQREERDVQPLTGPSA